MLAEILFIYLRSLLYAGLTSVLICGGWMLYHVVKKVDKTANERQDFFFDLLQIAILITPVISFAYVGIILMVNS